MIGLLGHRAADLDTERAEADLAGLQARKHLPPPSARAGYSLPLAGSNSGAALRDARAYVMPPSTARVSPLT